MDPPTLLKDEVALLEPGKQYVVVSKPTEPFTVTVAGVYRVFVSWRGNFMIQRLGERERTC